MAQIPNDAVGEIAAQLHRKSALMQLHTVALNAATEWVVRYGLAAGATPETCQERSKTYAKQLLIDSVDLFDELFANPDLFMPTKQ